ncbi:MAG: ATPase AAA [Gemmatales bacterium]|nr:MAG: ATPase AAA [Gemmatales bacterium]
MSWQKIRGHDRVVSVFQHVFRSGRLAHAYLFLGPEGIGKRLFARELAKALLCEQRQPEILEACDRCSACQLVDAETHPDFIETGPPEGSMEIPIDAIRALCHSFSLKSARGQGKVAVIDHSDELNEEAGNCFLKTLEEPPPKSLLLLVGTTPDRQLPTLVSRCQLIRFAPLANGLLADLLREHGVDDRLIDRLIQQSEGSLGQALALADPALWEFRQKLVTGLKQQRPDKVALAKDWMLFVEEAGKESASQRRCSKKIIRLLVDHFRDELHAVCRTAEQDEPYDNHAAREERILAMIDRLLEADHQIDRRVQLVLLVEALVNDLVDLRLANAVTS